MSIKVLKAYEPRLDIEAERVYVCTMGPSSLVIAPQTATNISTSQIQWTVTTPGTSVGVDRRIDKDITFFLDYNDPANPAITFANPLTNAPTTVGLRQYCVDSITAVESVKINDQLFTWEPQDLIAPLQQYGNEVEDRQYYCASPHMPDQYFTYDVAGVNSGPRNPYANYFQNVQEDSRSVQFTATLASNPNAAAPQANKRLVLRVRYPCFSSPFVYGRHDFQCLFGVQKIDLNLTLSSNLNRFMGGLLSPLLTNPAAGNEQLFTISPSQNIGDHKLWINYLTPPINLPIPSRLVYPYYQLNKFTQQFSFSPSGTTAAKNLSVAPYTLTYNAIQFNEIPKRIYHYARQNINGTVAGINQNYILPDYTACINGVTINFNNQDGRLSQSDSLALWKLSTKSGLRRSYIEWSQTVGAVLCLECGTDLTLNPLEAQGVRGVYNYQPQITYAVPPALVSYINSAGSALASTAPYDFTNWLAYTIAIPDGVLMIDNTLCSISVGGITEQMLAMAPFASSGFRSHVHNMYGGSWYGNLWNGIKKAFKVVAPIAAKVAHVAGTILPFTPIPGAQYLGTAANAIGTGLDYASKKANGGKRLRNHSLRRRM